MSRLTDEIETLVESTAGERLHGFEPVRAKRRQLVRRRYTVTAAATLVVAALVGYTLQDAGPGHKAAPAAPTPKAVTPSLKPPAAQAGGVPHFAGTAWHIDGIGSNPGAYTTGAGPVDDDLFAQIRFSSDTNAIMSIGGVTCPMHFTRAGSTFSFTVGKSSKQNMSDDVQSAQFAIRDFSNQDLTAHLNGSGILMALVTSDGEVINLTRLAPVGPLGLPGGKTWSVRSISAHGSAVPIAPSLNARFRLDSSSEAEFAVGANNDLVGVLVTAGKVQLTPLPFTANKPKPGELAVTRALATLSGPLTAKPNGRTLVLTSAQGVTITLVSKG